MDASGLWISLLARIATVLVVALAPTALCAQPADSRAAERSEMPKRHAVLLVRAALPVPEETSVRSYLGGLPRMPSQFEWPVESPFGEPRALTFVAQVALSEVPEFPQRSLLPHAGTLYFFVSSDFDGVGDPASRVLFFEDEAAALPVVAPPNNIMLLGGSLYNYLHYYSRFWLDVERDPHAKVEFKYPLSFVVTESYPDDKSARQLDAWQAALGPPSTRDLRALYDAVSPEDDAWPFNWATAEHVALSLAASIERDADRVRSLPAEALAELTAIAAAARRWTARANAADPFAPLPAERAAEFRAWWRAQREVLDKASRESGFYGWEPERVFLNAIRYVVRLTSAAGGDARELIPPHYLQAANAETMWVRPTPPRDRWGKMPMHQMFGFGTRVQNAPIEHANDVLLLEVKGDEGLAWHDNTGCVLQLWVDAEALQALRLEEVQATLECD